MLSDIKLRILLNADDIALLFDSKENTQNILDTVSNWCASGVLI